MHAHHEATVFFKHHRKRSAQSRGQEPTLRVSLEKFYLITEAAHNGLALGLAARKDSNERASHDFEGFTRKAHEVVLGTISTSLLGLPRRLVLVFPEEARPFHHITVAVPFFVIVVVAFLVKGCLPHDDERRSLAAKILIALHAAHAAQHSPPALFAGLCKGAVGANPPSLHIFEQAKVGLPAPWVVRAARQQVQWPQDKGCGALGVGLCR